MGLYDRVFESDEEIQKLERSSRANPGDIPLHRRLAGKLRRAGRHRDAAKHTKELVKTAAHSTATERQSIKFRALKNRIGMARQVGRDIAGDMFHNPSIVHWRRVYERARPYTRGLESAWNSKRWFHKSPEVRAQHLKTAKSLAKQIRRIADRHDYNPHDLMTGPDPDHSAHEDAEFMAHLHGSHDHEHWDESGHNSEATHHSVGHADFSTQLAAQQFANSLEDRHEEHGVEIEHSKVAGGHRVEYGIHPKEVWDGSR